MICHPIDTLKAKLQVSSSSNITIRSIVQTTMQTEGIAGFYRGVGAVLIGGVPGVCVYITTYEKCKQSLQSSEFFQNYPFYSYMISGIAAEALW
jgi:hypothetical protein